MRRLAASTKKEDGLPLPTDPTGVPVDELARVPAVALFVDRARAARYDFSEIIARAISKRCRPR